MYKIIIVTNSGSELEKLLNEGWAIRHAYGGPTNFILFELFGEKHALSAVKAAKGDKKRR